MVHKMNGIKAILSFVFFSKCNYKKTPLKRWRKNICFCMIPFYDDKFNKNPFFDEKSIAFMINQDII